MLIKVLHSHPLAEVVLPTDKEIYFFTFTIKKYLLLENVWAAMDRLKLSMEKPGYRDGSNVQEYFNNG